MKKFLSIALAIVMVAAVFAAAATPVKAAAKGCPEGVFPMATAELASACKGELDGKSVTINGPFTEGDEIKFNAAIKEFEEWTGIDIKYTGSKEFEAAISAAIKGGTAPDIIDFPQPGLLKGFVAEGYILDANKLLNVEWLKTNYAQGWLDMSMMPGKDGMISAGVWNRNNGKSIVWYPKKAFDAAGYKVPTTWDELVALQEQIKADGDTPWCIGIESGAATGWPATDWMEEFMLRTTTLENYDNWSFPSDPAKRLPFTDASVKAAAEKLGELLFTEGNVYGGRKAIASTFFGDAPTPMFDDPAKCYMHKQGNFITSFFPEGKVAGVDYDFFYLPGIDPAYGKPFLVAGDIYSATVDRPEVRAVLDFFSRGESVKGWVAAGGTLSPHKDTQLEWYGSDIERKLAQLIAEATSVRFDGSDLMPGAVGAGSFWKGMTNWISGTTDLDTTLAEIDAAWPK